MAHIQKATKIAFPMEVTIRCPKCNTKLGNVRADIMRHDYMNGCVFEGKLFRGPVVYLEEVK